MARSRSPIACRIEALTAAERTRRSDLLARLATAIEGIEETPDGFALRLAPGEGVWMAAAEFASLEARCCPFLAFRLEAEEEQGPIRLRMTGREGVKEFLANELRLSQIGGTG